MNNKLFFLLLGLFLLTVMPHASAKFGNSLDVGNVASWNLNESTGNSALDDIAGRNLTFNGSSMWISGISGSGIGLNTTFMYANSTANFNGTSSNADFSVSFWTYFTGVAPPDYAQIIVSKWGAMASCDWSWGTYGTNVTAVHYNNVNPFQMANNITYRVWTNWVLIHTDGSAMAVYKNGVFQGNAGTGGTNCGLKNMSNPLIIFRPAMNGFSNPANIYLDQIEVWNKTLNSTEIASLNSSSFNNQGTAGSPSTPFNVTLVSDNSSASYPIKNTPVSSTAYWQSNVSLSTYIFSTNATGVWVNDSVVTFSGTTNTSNITKTATNNKTNVTSWKIFANNSEGVWLSTGIYNYTVANAYPTSASAVFSATDIYQNTYVYFNISINDTDGLSDISSVIATLDLPTTTRVNTTTSVNFSKYASNPISLNVPNGYCGDYRSVETSGIYDNGAIHLIFRCSNVGDTRTYLFYTNSTDGINFTTPINISSPYGQSFPNFGMPYLQKINSTYYLMTTQLNATNKVVFIFNSTDLTNWNYACRSANTINSTGINLQNPSWYYNSTNGRSYALIEQGNSPFQLHYWNSTGICDGWTDKGEVYSNGGNAWITYLNNKFVVYYGNTILGGWRFNLAEGNSLDNLSLITAYVINITQGWENTHISDPDFVIIPDGVTTTYAKSLLYYLGDQNHTGVAYDSQNRSFLDMHFPNTATSSVNLTLSQFISGSNIWNTSYNATSLGRYNISYVYVNDSSNAFNYSTYTGVYFNVTSQSANITITQQSPINAYSSSTNNVDLITYVSSNVGIVNVSLYWNNIVNATNTSTINNSNYTFTMTSLADGSSSWIVQVCTSSSCTNSSTRTLTIDSTAPVITIVTPTNTTYVNTTITLNSTTNEAISLWWYSLNGGSNTTFSGNTTLSASNGSNTLFVYANDSLNNVGNAQVSFIYNDNQTSQPPANNGGGGGGSYVPVNNSSNSTFIPPKTLNLTKIIGDVINKTTEVVKQESSDKPKLGLFFIILGIVLLGFLGITYLLEVNKK